MATTERVRVRDADGTVVGAELLLEAYRQRCFPMAEGRDGTFRWFRPATRAVITWDAFHVPRSLRRRAATGAVQLTRDQDFAAVIRACADRRETWISHQLEALYLDLHALGKAHSVEAWDADGSLIGGLYGLVLGGCFCGESMFHRVADASKLCVLHLVEHLQQREFALLDCQQQTPHMARFGAREIPDADYAALLENCLSLEPAF